MCFEIMKYTCFFSSSSFSFLKKMTLKCILLVQNVSDIFIRIKIDGQGFRPLQ
jgi:hypothetical protein